MAPPSRVSTCSRSSVRARRSSSRTSHASSPKRFSPVSTSWFERAQARIPGGVNSPVRAFGSVGGEPFFVARAEGSRIFDTDGHEYIDYVQSWGASILGHAHPKIVEAVQLAASEGTS